MVGYLTSLRVVVCKCVRTRSERMLHATLSLASGVGGSRIAASCADDPQQDIIARARRICRGKWMGGPGFPARDPACRTRVANGHQMRWRTSSLGCLCLPPRASGGVASGCRRTNVEARRGHHPHATSATTREDWRSSARDAPSRAESPRKAWLSGRCRNRLWRWC